MAVASNVEDHEDLIVDDFSIENANDLGCAATKTALGGIKERPPPGHDNAAATNKPSLQIGSQRFKIQERASSLCITPGTSGRAKAELSAIDMRPWAEKYGPSTFEELMVHKKKVSDVRQWLEGALRGHDYKVCHSKGNCCLQSLTVSKRLLVLKGPSGAGKTATISMLAKVMDIDVSEWKNPVGSQFSSEAYSSMCAQFEDFLGRSGRFNKLVLAGRLENVPAAPSRTTDTLGGKTRGRIILMEEFPNTFLSTSVALRSFRSSVLQHVSSNPPSIGASQGKEQDDHSNITPMVMIITETRLTTVTSASDTFTVHRLLGPELLSHPCVSIIEFNPIASTYLIKALDLVVQKEARQSGRRRIPGPAVLQKLGEAGDIRSAIGSLQFLCLRGGNGNDWGGRVASRAKKGANTSSPLTKLEKDSLAMVAQRESNLGLFHSVGKVVYNKREDFDDSDAASEPPTQPPHHLPRHIRSRKAQVSANKLIDETGTDIETFIAALHENFVLSCNGKSFTDNLNGCIDALSDSDILGSPRGGRYTSFKGRGNYTSQGPPSDTLRQDDICFQIAVRGLLFSLPDPVRRRTYPMSSKSEAGGDAYKMFYPSSIKLSRQMEEVDDLVAQWTDRFRASGVKLGQANSRHGRQFIDLPSKQEVQCFKTKAENLSHFDENCPLPFRTSLGCTKDELVVERLPYIMKIEQCNANSANLRGLERITQFHDITLWGNRVNEEEEEEKEDVGHGTPLSDSTTNGEGNVTHLAPSREPQRGVGQANKAASTLVLPVGEEVGTLYISDDDIEDD